MVYHCLKDRLSKLYELKITVDLQDLHSVFIYSAFLLFWNQGCEKKEDIEL